MSKNLVYSLLLAPLIVACNSLGEAGDVAQADAQSAKAAVKAGTISSHQLTSSGLQRDYMLYKPINASDAAPVVMVLHGSTGSGEGMRDIAGASFERLADQLGFVLVYPTGFENHWNDCRGSADYSANTQNIDDPTFFADLLQELGTKHGVDSNQAFITGLSNGGQMAYRLALETPTLFKAYAAVIASLPEDRNLDCEKTRTPVSMMIINGAEDPINPYKGGVVSIGSNSSRGPVTSSRETALYWAGLAGNRRPPSQKTFPERDGNPDTSVTEKLWQKGNGYQVKLLTMHGSGHVFPSPDIKMPKEYIALLGQPAGDIEGAEQIINFFFQLPTE